MNFSTQAISFHTVKFRDFVPERLVKGNLFTASEYESLDDVLKELDLWIEENPEVMIVNIETVVLPNIHNRKEEGSEDPELVANQHDSSSIRWHQFFRVWYK